MSTSYTISNTQTFTLTHAKYLSAKVATDLKRMQRFYSMPTDQHILDLEAEMTELLKAGYLEKVTYGFQRNGAWIAPALSYTANELSGLIHTDDDPGRVFPNSDVTGASFYSYLCYSNNWHRLTTEQQNRFESGLAIKRTTAQEPLVNGYFSSDKIYSSGGQSLERSSLKSY